MPADDRIIALWSKRRRIAAQLAALDPADMAGDAAAQPLVDELVSIDDKIAASVPASAAGASVLLRLLREHVGGDPLTDQILSNLAVAFERLE
jgi:hypothetical protein